MKRRSQQNVPKEGEYGFTLLELMVVVVIMSIVAALCMPSFYSMWAGAQKYTVASQFADLGLLAHNRAIFTRKDVGLVIDKDENAFWLRKEGKRGFTLRDDDTRERVVKLPSDYQFDEFIDTESDTRNRSGETSIFFRPDGTADAVRVILKRNQTGRAEPVMLIFTVHRATGMVTWKEQAGSEYYDYEEEEDAQQ